MYYTVLHLNGCGCVQLYSCGSQTLQHLCIDASDSPEVDLRRHFAKCFDFIHGARVAGGAVVVHCLAGVSRSVTVSVAYVIAITSLPLRDALNSVRGVRRSL